MSSITVHRHSQLPSDKYALIDSYCTDLDCDCRVVYIFVVSQSQQRQVASITFGWQSLEFFRKWMGADEVDDMIRDLKGPALMPMGPQSEFAPILRELVGERLQEKAYVQLLKRHYKEFRKALTATKKKSDLSW